MNEQCINPAFLDQHHLLAGNLDWFFTHLDFQEVASVKTFYVENLRFIHYIDYVHNIFMKGLYYWKSGRLYVPALCNECGLGEFGSFPIATEAVKLDVGLTEEEAALFFRSRMNQQALNRRLCTVSDNRPKTLSIVICADNVEEYIMSCLIKLSRQTSQDFEIILIDDASTDATLKLGHRMSEIFYGRMTIIQNETPRGVLESVKAGLRLARGRYVMFLDCRDLLQPDFVQVFCDAADRLQVDVLQSDRYFVPASDARKYRNGMSLMEIKSETRGGMKIIRSEFLKQSGILSAGSIDRDENFWSEFQRRLLDDARSCEWIRHVSHIHQSRDIESVDGIYAVYTFHGTRFFLNSDLTLSHLKETPDSEAVSPVFVRQSDNGTVLFIIKDDQVTYISLNDKKVELSDVPSKCDCEMNSNGTFSIVIDKKYLSARRDTGNFDLRPKKLGWEMFALSDVRL